MLSRPKKIFLKNLDKKADNTFEKNYKNFSYSAYFRYTINQVFSKNSQILLIRDILLY